MVVLPDHLAMETTAATLMVLIRQIAAAAAPGLAEQVVPVPEELQEMAAMAVVSPSFATVLMLIAEATARATEAEVELVTVMDAVPFSEVADIAISLRLHLVEKLR